MLAVNKIRFVLLAVLYYLRLALLLIASFKFFEIEVRIHPQALHCIYYHIINHVIQVYVRIPLRACSTSVTTRSRYLHRQWQKLRHPDAIHFLYCIPVFRWRSQATTFRIRENRETRVTFSYKTYHTRMC